MISAGRVLLIPKGEYDSSETYTMLDMVSYQGSSYIAKGTTTGNLPTNTTYWQLFAYGGAASVAGNFATLETTAYASQPYSHSFGFFPPRSSGHHKVPVTPQEQSPVRNSS